MMPFVLGDRRADEVRGQLQHGVVIELGGEPFLRQFDPIACHTGKADFEGIAVGTNGLDLDGLAGRLRRRNHRLGGEVEGDAQHIGIFDVEQVLFVEVVGLAAQGTADDLLAQKLRAEGAHAQNMGDGVGVPAFGEHGNRYHAADRVAEAAFLADGVHDFPQQILIGEVLGLTAVAGAFDDLTTETFDLVGGHGAEVVVQRIPGFELLAVDQERARAGKRVAVLIEISE